MRLAVTIIIYYYFHNHKGVVVFSTKDVNFLKYTVYTSFEWNQCGFPHFFLFVPLSRVPNGWDCDSDF